MSSKELCHIVQQLNQIMYGLACQEEKEDALFKAIIARLDALENGGGGGATTIDVTTVSDFGDGDFNLNVFGNISEPEIITALNSAATSCFTFISKGTTFKATTTDSPVTSTSTFILSPNDVINTDTNLTLTIGC